MANNNGGNKNQLSQKEGVFEAITRVLGKTEFEEPVKLERDDREKVRKIIFDGFKSGNIVFNQDMPDDKELMTYTSGLVSNWLRKDSRLNGDTKYEPKNPGARAGSGDEQLKAMKALREAQTDPKIKAEIEKEIEKRLAELKPRKDINVNALPEHLRQFVPESLKATASSNDNSSVESVDEENSDVNYDDNGEPIDYDEQNK